MIFLEGRQLKHKRICKYLKSTNTAALTPATQLLPEYRACSVIIEGQTDRQTDLGI